MEQFHQAPGNKAPLPSGIPLPGQEESNASYLEEHHAAIWLKNDDNIEETLSNVLDNSNTLEKLQTQAKLIGKPNSTRDICEIILNSKK